jgi:molybdopterin/thiamine biosynthesis adenylyltransferase
MNISVFGLGALGSNLLLQLARQFPDSSFLGVDYDKVEERNIPIQAYFLEQVGMKKVDAMNVVLRRYLRRPKYTPQQQYIQSLVTEFEDDLVLDCFDNVASRRFLKGASKNVLHIGFSPFYTAECIWDHEYDLPGDVDPKANDVCQMQDAVGFIHFTVNAALLNISRFVIEKRKTSFLITNRQDIKWL